MSNAEVLPSYDDCLDAFLEREPLFEQILDVGLLTPEAYTHLAATAEACVDALKATQVHPEHARRFEAHRAIIADQLEEWQKKASLARVVALHGESPRCTEETRVACDLYVRSLLKFRTQLELITNCSQGRDFKMLIAWGLCLVDSARRIMQQPDWGQANMVFQASVSRTVHVYEPKVNGWHTAWLARSC